jgi:hypothetical protein
MTVSPPRPEARCLFGYQTTNELGAPVASSIPEQLPGHEPASARKGYEDAVGLGIDVSKDRLDIMVLQQCFSVRNHAAGWAELVERLRGLSISAIGLEASGGFNSGLLQ